MTSLPEPRRPWQVVRGLLPPFLWIALLFGVMLYGLQQLADDTAYEKAVLHEWVLETRVYRQTLPELVRDLDLLTDPNERKDKAEAIQAHLAVMGDLTRTYPGQLPLFPVIYRMELAFPPLLTEPIVWASSLPGTSGGAWSPLNILLYEKDGRQAVLRLDYQLHAYTRWQETAAQRRNWLMLIAVVGAVVATLWLFFTLRHEEERTAQRLKAQEELREAERQLLEQRFATQAAEQKALEAKTQMYAHIGIMAGSYAHNIKNLMVRPVDLLRRCREEPNLPGNAADWLAEMETSLHAVGERTQQILHMVRADPAHTERRRCDLGQLLRDVADAWMEMAQQKWKMRVSVKIPSQPVWIEADASQVTQALENLLFNARDATFEMRALLRDEARQQDNDAARKEALLAAASWKGEVRLAVREEEHYVVVEVRDNGLGMTPDVLARCTEPHFSTKRDSALHEGHATGMGLGLTFVKAVMEHHQGELRIDSAPRQGAVFMLRFPRAEV